MKEERDIVGVSLAWTAGTAAASAAGFSFALAVFASGAVFFTAALWFLYRKCGFFWALLFFSAMLCHAAASYAAGNEDYGILGYLGSRASGPLGGFSGLLDTLPLGNDEDKALLRALLTGQRERLSRATVEAFRHAGASHILALSGMHLGIIYLVADRLFSLLGGSNAVRRTRSAVNVCLSWFYAIMTGAGPSIVRAALFISIREIMRHFPGRRTSPLRTICCALLVHLALDPLAIGSTGFQLSYLAMAGICTVHPVLSSWYIWGDGGKFDPARRIWDSMSLAVSCQLATFPLVFLRFHSFPVYFLLSNLISVPLAGVGIVSGLTCAALAALSGPGSWICRLAGTVCGETLGLLRKSLEIISTM